MLQPSPIKQKLIESYNKQMDDITCILDCGQIGSLYLGNVESACDFELLKKLKIKSIISICTTKIPIQISSAMKYYQQIVLEDTENANIYRHFEICFEFIEKGRSIGNVLVHCMAGISRSATIVAAYLMKKHFISSQEALQQLQRKRWQVYPNEGFIKQLFQYDEELKDKQKELKKENIGKKKQEINIINMQQVRNSTVNNNNNLNLKNSNQNEKNQQSDEYQKIRKKYIDLQTQQQNKKQVDYKSLQERKIDYHKRDSHNVEDNNIGLQQTQKFQRISSIHQQGGIIDKNSIKNQSNYLSIQKHQLHPGLQMETKMNVSQKYFDNRVYPSTTRNQKNSFY